MPRGVRKSKADKAATDDLRQEVARKGNEDIFAVLDKLFRKEPIEGSINSFTLHRFLASDPAYAPVAKELSKIWDEPMVANIWQAALPTAPKSPFFKWPAPKKNAASSELVKKISDTENCSLLEAEEVVSLLEELNLKSRAYAYYGVEAS